MGHEVEAVADGAEAIQAIRMSEFDIVVMDMQMPVLDGLEATRAIRASDSDFATLPIIALTADVLQEDHARFLSAGVTSVLTKPVDWVSLGAEIDRLLVSSFERAGLNNAVAASDDGGAGQGALVLDEALLIELGDAVGHDVLAPMLGTFRDNMLQYQASLADAANTGDIKRIKNTAHALKGLCAQFGASHVSKLALEVEQKSADLDGVRRMLPDFAEGVNEAKMALEKYLAKPAG